MITLIITVNFKDISGPTSIKQGKVQGTSQKAVIVIQYQVVSVFKNIFESIISLQESSLNEEDGLLFL